MNPYFLIKDLKAGGLLNPLFARGFSIDASFDDPDYWVGNIKTSLGSIFLRNTGIGFVEMSIPIVKVLNSHQDVINMLVDKFISFHADCVGHVTAEYDEVSVTFFYHISIPDSYDKDLLDSMIKLVTEETGLAAKVIASIYTDESGLDFIDLDRVKIDLEKDNEQDEDND